jgi:hypothetical protein
MALHVDLTGRKYGRLTVVKSGGKQIYAGKPCYMWWTLCDCGREELVPQSQLSRRKAGCAVCRRGPCVVCGGEIVRETTKNTCCDQCEQEKRRNIYLKSYYKKVADDPEYNIRRHLQTKERIAQDPEFAARYRELGREANRRKRANPEYREKVLEYSRQYYAENSEAIQHKRKMFFAQLPPEEQERIRERDRAYSRKWRRKFQQWLSENPSEYENYRQRYREWVSEAKRRQVLAEIAEIAEKLEEKLNEQ